MILSSALVGFGEEGRRDTDNVDNVWEREDRMKGHCNRLASSFGKRE